MGNVRVKIEGIIATTLVALGVSSPVFAASSDVLTKIETDMVKLICADGGEWLRCYSKNPNMCKSYATAIVRPCIDEQLKYVTSGVSLESALQYSVELKSCFNRAVPKELGEPLPTKECTEGRPAHLW